MNTQQLLSQQPKNEEFTRTINLLADVLSNYSSMASYNDKCVVYHIYHVSDVFGERSLVLHYFHRKEQGDEHYVPFIIQAFTPLPTNTTFTNTETLILDIRKRLN